MDDVLVSDLVLTDEHETVGLDESISSAAEKLLDLGRGVLVVVGDGNKVKGIVTPNQVLAAVAAGADTAAETCGDHMDADVMEVGLDDNVDDIIETMNERKPHAVVAVDALGHEQVHGVMMPSPFTSQDSIDDAKELANRLEVRLDSIAIEPAMDAFDEMLKQGLGEPSAGVTKETIQRRARGLTLMAISNTTGVMLVTTGNKSEMSVGYATIYGDMAGGYAVIKDVPKTMVYRLAEHRNARSGRPVIPSAVLEKPPSAELRPDQVDEDSLPPYEELDQILKAYVEDDLAFDEIVDLGFSSETVKQIISLVDRNEYKRRQAAPGIKITPRNFGRDRRMPIANRYRPF